MGQTEVTGMNTDNEKSLHICGCGWRKVTTFRGLQIHQTRMRCKGNIQQQPCTAMADQARGTKGQVKKHSDNGSIVAGESESVPEKGPLEKSKLPCEHQENTSTCFERPEPRSTEKKEPARRNNIKWPKTSEAVAVRY